MMNAPTSFRAHAPRALALAVLVALAAGPVLIAPVAAETAAPQIRLTVDAQERTRLIEELSRHEQTSVSTNASLNQLNQHWADAQTASDEQSYASALEAVVRSADVYRDQVDRYIAESWRLHARLVDLYAKSVPVRTSTGPKLSEIAPQIADFGSRFEQYMSDDQKAEAAQYLAVGDARERMRQATERLKNPMSLASQGDFKRALRTLRISINVAEINRTVVEDLRTLIEARAYEGLGGTLTFASLDHTVIDSIMDGIDDTVFRFMDEPKPVHGARPPTTGVFDRLLH